MSSHASLNRSPRKWRAWQLASGFVVWTTAFCLVTLAASSSPASASAHRTNPAKPVKLSVLSPGTRDNAGNEGAGFVVDLTLTARNKAANKSISAEAGYKPFFNNPSAPTFHPGPNQGAPGLVVMLSTTPNTPGTPFQGPRTNLAGLFQINGVTSNNGLIQVRNTWQIAKAGFGSGPSTLTVFVVDGTAPTLVPDTGLPAISNRITVPFTITAPTATAPSPASANLNATLKVADD